MQHQRNGQRTCSATDLILVAGGVQCSNCLAHTVPELPPRCIDRASDGPCPLGQDKPDGRCWIHNLQREEKRA